MDGNANWDKYFGIKMKLFIPYQPASPGLPPAETFAHIHKKIRPTLYLFSQQTDNVPSIARPYAPDRCAW